MWDAARAEVGPRRRRRNTAKRLIIGVPGDGYTLSQWAAGQLRTSHKALCTQCPVMRIRIERPREGGRSVKASSRPRAVRRFYGKLTFAGEEAAVHFHCC